MNIIETIRAEIERRKNTAETMRERGAYLDLLCFLDTLPEQPVEGLEEEIERYWKEEMPVVTESDLNDIARYFYDLGCRHTAVMYDDIEYKRQMAEEAELSGDLEDEIDRQLDVFPYTKVTPELPESRLILIQKQLRPFARHFAEWGASHAKTPTP